jgi:hypothetical protein
VRIIEMGGRTKKGRREIDTGGRNKNISNSSPFYPLINQLTLNMLISKAI